MEDVPGAEAPVRDRSEPRSTPLSSARPAADPEARLGAWLALALAAPLGPPVCRRLRERFPDPARLGDLLLDASGAGGRRERASARAALAAADGPLTPAHVAALDETSTRRRVDETFERLARDPLARVVPIEDSCYPAALAESLDPPPLLWLRGSPETFAGPAVAIVGSRDATHGGRELARALARELGASGLVVVSGLALGLDAAAHAGALEGGGRTLAFVATGIDDVYPRRHRALAEAMLERGGAMASEFPLDHPPKPWCFPQRNRLISAASLGVVVVEAKLPSGSLTTARHALEQGREVMAVPGAVDNPGSAGCHALIRDGAALVASASDVLRVLAAPLERALVDASTDGSSSVSVPSRTPAIPSPTSRGASPADDTEREIRGALASGPATLDRLLARCAADAPATIAALARLELAGLVVVDGGGRYALRHGH